MKPVSLRSFPACIAAFTWAGNMYMALRRRDCSGSHTWQAGSGDLLLREAVAFSRPWVRVFLGRGSWLPILQETKRSGKRDCRL